MKSSPEVVIRIADASDSSYIALLGRVTFTETFGHLFTDPEDLLHYLEATFSVSKIERSLKKSKTVYWIAFADRLPVGYAKLKLESPSPFITTKKISQLQKIYVLKDFLSLKIGFNLQKKMLEKAKKLGSNEIWLSVLNSNDRAINFYLKNGFKLIGNHDFKIGKEHFEFLAMSKRLA